ncbi:MAG: MarR family transcriptional regulator, partial [Rhodobacteraceae bacterium]|nr:MarR family transcriptional regulator [Paracoccaceae bacterium]
QGELSQNLLGRLVALDTATTKGVVDRLRAKSLIQSRPDVSDKRRAIISLTDAGRSMIAALKEDGRRITETTLNPLKSSEKRKLLELLKKIV